MIGMLKKFYGFLWKYKWAFLVFLFVLTLSGIVQNLTPYIYKLLVDQAPSGDYAALLKLVLLFVGIRIASNLLETLSIYIGDKSLLPASRDARVDIFKHIQNLDLAFHVNKSTGSLISIFKRGDGAFYSLFHQIHIHVLQTMVGYLVTLFFFNLVTPSIVWIMLIVFIGNAFLSWRLIENNIIKRRSFNEAEDEISGIIADNMINYETVKFFTQEKREEKRLKTRFKDWLKKLWSYANSFRLMDIAVGTFSNLGILAIFIIIIKKLAAGQIGVGDMVLVFSFTTGFYIQFFELLYTFREIAKNYTDIERYFAILDEEIMVKDPEKPVRVNKITGAIAFQNVGFDYPDGEKGVLKDFNLSISPNDSIAFVGRSGVGKTTIIRLLLRFYDVTTGKIMLDGIDIRKLSKSQLRSFIGVVPQEPILFNNTIGFNIAYGKSNTGKKEIMMAAKAANIHEFIKSLPMGLKTQVGERGIKLSGGQKQRLAIARVIVTDPKVIIFDEATSSLDSESESLIQDALWKIARNRTVLIIAHRLSTVRRAKKIVVLEQGKVAETGSHRELINKKGLYSYLWHLQTKGHTKESALSDLQLG